MILTDAEAARMAAIEARLARYDECVALFNAAAREDRQEAARVYNANMGSIEWQTLLDLRWLLGKLRAAGGDGGNVGQAD